MVVELFTLTILNFLILGWREKGVGGRKLVLRYDEGRIRMASWRTRTGTLALAIRDITRRLNDGLRDLIVTVEIC